VNDAQEPSPAESLLVFSDVHLGSDLNDRGSSPRRSTEVDQDLVQLVRHYLRKPPAHGRWRVVIAGDFIDFIGMSIEPPEGDARNGELTEEEQEHGLGSSSDHAREKLRRVVQRHPETFDALSDLVAAGHALTLVHGNHDIEFHWEGVQDDFTTELLRRTQDRSAAGTVVDTATFRARVNFEPWFYCWNEVAYIEHGHQYDAYCASDHVMAPLSPLDPRRVMRGFSSILLRYVVRRTRGMKEHGHETMGTMDYLRFGASLGLSGLLRLGNRFKNAVLELFRLRRAHMSEAMTVLRAEHERRMELLALARNISMDRLRALAALQVPPITHSVRGIIASVLLDRLALGLFCSITLLVLAVVGIFHGHVLWGALGVLAAWGLANRWLARERRLDPADELVVRAGHLAALMPVAFVVMGHTHVPLQRDLPGQNARYFNLGSWAEEEDLDERGERAYRAARTHLVIDMADGKANAELRAWTAEGPQPYKAA
jgi:UDP-2,3-diacylglucosamine pyrophosphatase LpxH